MTTILDSIKKVFGVLLPYKVKHDRKELVEILHHAEEEGVVTKESIPVIEAVLHMDKLRAKDIMLPRHQIDVLDISDDMDVVVQKIMHTGHSRFPVVDEDISDILGVFHSKDLIQYFNNQEEFNLRSELRQTFFVPEIKHLDGLLFEMRMRQSHMAIVVDEFTNVVGLITLEMIVEQIFGEIEDEHDLVESEREIIELEDGSYRLKGYCTLQQLNQTLRVNWHDDRVETVGGYLIKFLNRIPISGEILEFGPLKIEIVDSDSRKINLLLVRLKDTKHIPKSQK